MTNAIYPVILSGDAGKRLWPLSRQSRPKQFLNIHGESSMFAQTLSRVGGGIFAPPVVVCNDGHRFLVAEELRRPGVVPTEIILESAARNTAPAIAVAALWLAEQDAAAVLLVLPSDHAIGNVQAFHDAIENAFALAQAGYLVTLGVKPKRAETGYGYIRQGASLGDGCWSVEEFVEKPDQITAEGYVAKDGYYWNSGIFIFRAKSFLDELRSFHPEILESATRALENGTRDLDFFRLDATAFESAPSISIDYAVMEKTERAAMVPLNAGWSDVGSWARLWELGTADMDGNVTEGKAVVFDARNNFVRSEKPLIAALGVTDLAIIATDDTVLVLPKDRAQEVKDIVTALDTAGHHETINHTRVYRPWGHYQNLEAGDGFLVKRIVVNPGAKLSLQYHHHRAEHWVVVAGAARVTNGDKIFDLGPNQSSYIPKGAPHRLANPGSDPLHLIEVQSGDYIGEDDIVRLEDTYGRD